MNLDLARGPAAIADALAQMLKPADDLPADLAGAPPSVRAIARQRMRRARWIAAQRLSQAEVCAIPLDFDPAPEADTQ